MRQKARQISALYLGAINNADRKGRISIEDTAKNSLTTIFTGNEETKNGYTPVKNSAYSWDGRHQLYDYRFKAIFR